MMKSRIGGWDLIPVVRNVITLCEAWFHFIATGSSSCWFPYPSTCSQCVRCSWTLVIKHFKELQMNQRPVALFALSLWTAGYTFTKDILEQDQSVRSSPQTFVHLVMTWDWGVVSAVLWSRVCLFFPGCRSRVKHCVVSFTFTFSTLEFHFAVSCDMWWWRTAFEAHVILF